MQKEFENANTQETAENTAAQAENNTPANAAEEAAPAAESTAENTFAAEEAQQPEAAIAEAPAQVEQSAATENQMPNLFPTDEMQPVPVYDGVQPADVKVKKKLNKKVIIIGAAAFVLIAIIALVAGITQYKQKQVSDYKAAIYALSYSMISGAAEAEEAGNLVSNVWHDAIFESYDSDTFKYVGYTYGYKKYYYDFNTALSNLYSDSDFKSKISSIQAWQSVVTDKMKEMSDPPYGCEDGYAALVDCYETFMSFTNTVINVSGSYNTFTSAFSDADSAFMSCYNKMELYYD